MEIEDLQHIANAFKGITYDIKWESNLCFCIGSKIFAMVNIDSVPTRCSFKQTADSYTDWLEQDGFISAPYLGRSKWVQVDDIRRLDKKAWQTILEEAYAEIFRKLPKRLRVEIEGI